MNKEILKNITYGLYLISTNSENKPEGCIANSVIQVTYDKVLVSLNLENYTNECIKNSKEFAISILSEETDPKIIGTFGYKSGRNCNKFEGINSHKIGGLEVLNEAVGYITCKLINIHECGTHTIFIGEMQNGEILKGGNPMTYSYYHKVLKGSSPKASPSYVENNKKEEKTMNYKCKICGYIYEGDISKEPEDYVCPICGANREQFELIEE